MPCAESHGFSRGEASLARRTAPCACGQSTAAYWQHVFLLLLLLQMPTGCRPVGQCGVLMEAAQHFEQRAGCTPFEYSVLIQKNRQSSLKLNGLKLIADTEAARLAAHASVTDAQGQGPAVRSLHGGLPR